MRVFLRSFVLISSFSGVALHVSHAQLLFPESFTMILDTTRHVQGSITPSLKVQTQKELLIEFENMADLAIRMKKFSLTFANKFELSQFGKDVLLSGGYVYGKFKKELDKKLMWEAYGQLHWAEARGMERKYAGGANLRWRIHQGDGGGVYAGIGPFYEYERWTYRAVQDDRLPVNTEPIENKLIKIGSYVRYKQQLTEKFSVDLSVYHQAKPADMFNAPRLGSSTRISYALSKHLQLIGLYQNIYDIRPVVPISYWFHRFVGTISVNF